MEALQAAFPLSLKYSCKHDHSPDICNSAQETVLGSTDLLVCSLLYGSLDIGYENGMICAIQNSLSLQSQ